MTRVCAANVIHCPPETSVRQNFRLPPLGGDGLELAALRIRGNSKHEQFKLAV